MSVKSAKTKRNTDGEKETWEYKTKIYSVQNVVVKWFKKRYEFYYAGRVLKIPHFIDLSIKMQMPLFLFVWMAEKKLSESY